IERVSTGRKMSVEATKEIAQGRVWTGKRGKEIGLVDELGNLEDAIKIAGEKANITSYKVVEYPTIEEDFFSTLIREISKGKDTEDVTSLFVSKEERKLYEQYQQVKGILRCKEPNARLPFLFEFN
ncbi:MAG TPA: S49 family peptidase, partial [Saprospiraceae bacterium]|nr:S49 family peptidase [Saprospiraceae bacterium]